MTDTFTEWFDREVETGVRFSDNVVAVVGPWSDRRERYIREIMRSAFDAGREAAAAWNTRADLVDQMIAEAVAKARKEWALQYLSDESQWMEAIDAAVARERERCAEIVRCEQSDMTRKHYDRFSSALAAIREGGE